MRKIELTSNDIKSGLYTENQKYRYVDNKKSIFEIEIQSSHSNGKILEIEEMRFYENYKLINDLIEDEKNEISHFFKNTKLENNKIVISNDHKPYSVYPIEKTYDTKINFQYKIDKVGVMTLDIYDIFSGYKFNFKLKSTEETKGKFFNFTIESNKHNVLITLAEINVKNENNEIIITDVETPIKYAFSINDKRLINLSDNSSIRRRDIFNLTVNDFNILDLSVTDNNVLDLNNISSLIGNDVKFLFIFNSKIDNKIYIREFSYLINDEEILSLDNLKKDTQLKSVVKDNIPLEEIDFLLNRFIPISFNFSSFSYVRIKPYLRDLTDKLIFKFKSTNKSNCTLVEFNGHVDFKYLFNEHSESLDLLIDPSSGTVYYKRSSKGTLDELTKEILSDEWILYQLVPITETMSDMDITELNV